MMKWLRKIFSRVNKIIKIILISLPVFASIALVEKKQDEKDCRMIIIKVENTLGNYFIEEKDVMDMVTNKGHRVLVGMPLKSINMKAIEKDVNELKFVKNTQVYRDLKGNLIVSVEQQRPIARIVRPNAPDAYISEDGILLPTSNKYSARTLILRGPYTNKLIDEGLIFRSEGLKLLQMLRFIDGDKYWKAQVAEIEFDASGNMILHPQVGKQEFIFGGPDDYEAKFKRINIFYNKIRPLKGWDYYDRVNLKYKNQIVCD
jgi:cell division protein FtsQ